MLYWLGLWSLAGVGMLLLARHLGAPAWGAFTVALGWTFSGWFTGHASHLSFVHGYAWLPWVLWRLDVALEGGGSLPALQGGALFGLAALAAYPGVVFGNAVFLALWGIGRALFPADDHRDPLGARLARSVRVLVALATVALVVLSPTYLALVFESAGYSHRSEALPRELALSSNAWHPLASVTCGSPYLVRASAGSDSRGPSVLWPDTDVTSVSLYAGGLVLWLAAIALVRSRGAEPRLWILGLALLGLALAASRALPLRGWLYDLVPPSRYFRHSAIFRGWFILAVCVLASLGARDIAARIWAGSGPARSPIVCAAVIGCAVWIAHLYLERMLPSQAGRPLGRLHLALVWSGTLLVALRVGSGPSRRWPGIPILMVLVAGVDAALTHRLSSFSIFTQADDVRSLWQDVNARRGSDLELLESVGQRREPSSLYRFDNKYLAIKVPVLKGYLPLANARYDRLTQSDALVQAITSKRRSSRMWFAREAVIVDEGPEAFDAFVRRSEQLGAPPLTVTGPAGDPAAVVAALASSQAAQRIPVELCAYDPTRLEMRVVCPEDGFLVVTERWARGWRATVNGRATGVERGMFLFRALWLPAGRNDVCFEYVPFGYPGSVASSWAILALVGAATVLRSRGRFRARASSELGARYAVPARG